MTIKTIFFDTSDTLYHNPEFEKAQKKQPILQLSEVKGITYEEAEILFKKTKEELKDKMVHVPKVAVMMELGISRLEMQEYLAKVDAKEYLTSDEELNNMLKRLKEKYKLGIITNILHKFLDDILTALDVDKNLFSYIVSVDNTSKSKPDKEPFLKAIELSGCQASECAYVGDSLTKDLIPVKSVGMKTVWVSKDDKDDPNVDVRIDSVTDVEEAF